MTGARERWVTGVAVLREYLHDDLALARALRERRWGDLLAAAEIAWGEIDHDIAITNPALYRSLRDAVMKFHLRSYGCLDAEALRARLAEPAPEGPPPPSGTS